MSKLPVEPVFGKVLIASAKMGCLLEATQVIVSFDSNTVVCRIIPICFCNKKQVVAMVSADNIFVVPR